MAYDRDNVFAKILRGELPCDRVYEDDHALAFRDINPLAPVHVLVVPKGEYVSMDDFSANAPPEAIAGFFRAVGETARRLGLAAGGYRFLANTGVDGNQEVAHFHVHIFGGAPLGRMLKKIEGPLARARRRPARLLGRIGRPEPKEQDQQRERKPGARADRIGGDVGQIEGPIGGQPLRELERGPAGDRHQRQPGQLAGAVAEADGAESHAAENQEMNHLVGAVRDAARNRQQQQSGDHEPGRPPRGGQGQAGLGLKQWVRLSRRSMSALAAAKAAVCRHGTDNRLIGGLATPAAAAAAARDMPRRRPRAVRRDWRLLADRSFIIDKLGEKAKPVPAIGRATLRVPGRIR